MAVLTYVVFSGQLVVVSDNGMELVTAMCQSGFSNYPWDSGKMVGDHGADTHKCGGPLPEGRWRVLSPGAPHPDGGKLRPNWIPVGPVSGRTHIYIHPIGTRTEGCVAVSGDYQFSRISEILRRDQGGWLHVVTGDVV